MRVLDISEYQPASQHQQQQRRGPRASASSSPLDDSVDALEPGSPPKRGQSHGLLASPPAGAGDGKGDRKSSADWSGAESKRMPPPPPPRLLVHQSSSATAATFAAALSDSASGGTRLQLRPASGAMEPGVVAVVTAAVADLLRGSKGALPTGSPLTANPPIRWFCCSADTIFLESLALHMIKFSFSFCTVPYTSSGSQTLTPCFFFDCSTATPARFVVAAHVCCCGCIAPAQ